MIIPSVYYDLKSSRYCTGFLSLIYGATGVMVFFLPVLPIALMILLSIICFWLLYLKLRVHAWRIADAAIIKIGQDSTRSWWLLDKRQTLHQVEILGDSLVTRYLLILNFRLLDNRKNLSLLIFPDGLAKDVFRQLQVRLLLNKSKPDKKTAS